MAINGAQDLTYTGPVSNVGGSHTLSINNTALTTFAGTSFTLTSPNATATLTLNIPASSGGTVIRNPIQNAGGKSVGTLVKTGAGNLVLAGTAANTFSGGLILNNGTITAGKPVAPDATSQDDTTPRR